MKKLKELIENIRNSIKEVATDEVWINPSEYLKHSDIVNNGESQLQKEYEKRVKKIAQLNQELKEIESACDEFHFKL